MSKRYFEKTTLTQDKINQDLIDEFFSIVMSLEFDDINTFIRKKKFYVNVIDKKGRNALHYILMSSDEKPEEMRLNLIKYLVNY